jgi:hypothetical protein
MVGQAQMVYGFISLSNRDGMALMQGAMFTTTAQKRIYRSPAGDVGSPAGREVQGDHDNMDNIYRAVDKAVQKAASDLQADFFRGL